ncbi:inositol monophosphatase family protein [Marinomonas sp.]
MMTEQYQNWLASALQWSRQAGEMIKQARQASAFVRDYKADHELVTTTDVAVDEYLCAEIARTYGDHIILSEESSPSLVLNDLPKGTPVWVIDPIDGTVNYAHGHLHVAVSIAVYLNGERVVGVVNAPFLGECYWATKDGGAFCNDRSLAVSGNTNLRNALVATGFPYQKQALTPIIERVSRILHACQDIRRNGSAALDLCWVASGRIDAYFETVKPWDMAAGALIAEEAGARVGRYAPTQNKLPDAIDGESLLVTTPELFMALALLLRREV